MKIFSGPEFAREVAVIILIVIGIIVAVTTSADEFGSYCIDKNGVERCTIWQWDSKEQKLIRKEITRRSIK